MSFIPVKSGLFGAAEAVPLLWDMLLSNPFFYFTNGELTATSTALLQSGNATIFVNSHYLTGKVYLELTFDIVNNQQHLGACVLAFDNTNDLDVAGAWSWRRQQDIYCNGVQESSNGVGPSNGGIVMIACDIDAGLFWCGVNGVWLENITQSPGNPGDPANGLFPACTGLTGPIRAGYSPSDDPDESVTLNTEPFYAVPSGFEYWGGPKAVANPVGSTIKWDPLRLGAGALISQRVFETNINGSSVGCVAADEESTGKWYVELNLELLVTKESNQLIGIADPTGIDWNLSIHNQTGVYGLQQDGTIRCNGGTNGSLAGYAQGDIVQVAVDLDAALIWFGVNGTFGGDPGGGVGEACSGVIGSFIPVTNSDSVSTTRVSINGAPQFAMPSGFEYWSLPLDE